ncbi:hypothetical protein E1B28_013807 [Marasmius oreades]|uniref:Hydrophobin n=1 Tax=Marasmius oreades TaxID=181124 RepID=A0A9P7RQH4_9AGAR|nr:uncharacterized protein E1B28_013807 [Marasmius oreades]KAG7087869.1 hypothetical protein E1B28_013807 [Marasmius oreades]
MLCKKFVSVSALATLAAGASRAIERQDQSPQCCQQVLRADSSDGQAILSLLNIVLQDFNVLVGFGCAPISVSDGGSGTCSPGTPVVCADASHGGIVDLDCVPIT